MTYEEKRAVRMEISQMLADAGLNQGTIKEMVTDEIKHKVDRAVDQAIASLNAESSSGNYFKDKITQFFNNHYMASQAFTLAIKEELKNRVISITLKGMEVDEEKKEN